MRREPAGETRARVRRRRRRDRRLRAAALLIVIGAVAERVWASVIVATIFLTPVEMNGPTVCKYEKTLSPATWSPCVPSS